MFLSQGPTWPWTTCSKSYDLQVDPRHVAATLCFCGSHLVFLHFALGKRDAEWLELAV